MWIENSLIEGKYVVLEPLSLEHVSSLIEAVKDGEHWKLWFANVPSPEIMHQYVKDAIAQMAQGNIAYAVRVKATNQIVGTTRYYNVDELNRRALIGYRAPRKTQLLTTRRAKLPATPLSTRCHAGLKGTGPGRSGVSVYPSGTLSRDQWLKRP